MPPARNGSRRANPGTCCSDLGRWKFWPQLQALGWPLLLVSNQPSFAKGKCSLEDLKAVHAALEALFLAGGVRFLEACYCFHHPHGIVPGYSGPCPCRKPSPYLLLQAGDQHLLDLAGSWMIGDQGTDLACGKAAGCRTLLIPNPASANKRGFLQPDLQCATLDELPQRLSLPR